MRYEGNGSPSVDPNLLKRSFNMISENMSRWTRSGLIASEPLGSVAWAICSTHHTTLQATPGQLVFGRDMLLNLKFVADPNKLKYC